MKLGIFSSLQKENKMETNSNNKASSSSSLFPYIMPYTNYSNLNSTSYSCQHSSILDNNEQMFKFLFSNLHNRQKFSSHFLAIQLPLQIYVQALAIFVSNSLVEIV